MIHSGGRIFTGSVQRNEDSYAHSQPRNYLEPIPLTGSLSSSRGGTFRVSDPAFEDHTAVHHGVGFRFGRGNGVFEVGESSRPPGQAHNNNNNHNVNGTNSGGVAAVQVSENSVEVIHSTGFLCNASDGMNVQQEIQQTQVHIHHHIFQRQRDPSQNFVEGKPQVHIGGVFLLYSKSSKLIYKLLSSSS